MTRIVDLSHPISAGMYTHPGLPGPAVAPFRTRESYREAAGTDFQVDRIDLVGNTGTYLDSPFHRFAAGDDLAAVPLTAVVDLPVHVVHVTHRRDVDVEDLAGGLGAGDLGGAAVLLHTGGDRAWGTEAYADSAPFLTGRGPASWRSDDHRVVQPGREGPGRPPPGAHGVPGSGQTPTGVPAGRTRARPRTPRTAPETSGTPGPGQGQAVLGVGPSPSRAAHPEIDGVSQRVLTLTLRQLERLRRAAPDHVSATDRTASGTGTPGR